MDCPSEEQIIRMKLSDVAHIQALEFDIPARMLTVYHTEDDDLIATKLEELQFGSSLQERTETEYSSQASSVAQERKILWYVLMINAFFFVLESLYGFISHSMGLVADSLDMLADSVVYLLALLAVGETVSRKKRVAKFAGILQVALACMGLYEVLKRCTGKEEMPEFQTMVVVSLCALIGNSVCLYILQKHRSQEAHVQASVIFTSNDIIINLGVVLAGGLVYATHSPYPDLIIGTIVFGIVARGAMTIFRISS